MVLTRVLYEFCTETTAAETGEFRCCRAVVIPGGQCCPAASESLQRAHAQGLAPLRLPDGE